MAKAEKEAEREKTDDRKNCNGKSHDGKDYDRKNYNGKKYNGKGTKDRTGNGIGKTYRSSGREAAAICPLAVQYSRHGPQDHPILAFHKGDAGSNLPCEGAGAGKPFDRFAGETKTGAANF